MPKHDFKTVYFPAARTRTGKPARVCISLPNSPHSAGVHPDCLMTIRNMSGREIREALGDPILEDLEEVAKNDSRSLSNSIFLSLVTSYEISGRSRNENGESVQLKLPFGVSSERGNGLGVTFRDSKRLPVHGWYPYVEGFSAQYVADCFFRFGSPRLVYDPFGGAGTVQAAASQAGIASCYCEVNPAMRFIAEAKITSAAWAHHNLSDWEASVKAYRAKLTKRGLVAVGKRMDLSGYHTTFPKRDFFEEGHLRELMAAKLLAEEVASNEDIRRLLLVACAANTVKSSNMTRRADLRRRRPDEYKNRVVDVSGSIHASLEQMTEDIRMMPDELAPTKCVGDDARVFPDSIAGSVDFTITSPPYLNGTNYFRNTKLELWLLGFINSEAQLREFRRTAICAGINGVSSDRPAPRTFRFVEKVAERLDEVAYDQRIPKMIRHYASDMYDVLAQTLRALRPGGHFVLDIGDSCFAGVHVPTHDILVSIAKEVGFECTEENHLANRYSKGPVQLTQKELVFRKPEIKRPGSDTGKDSRNNQVLRSAIRQFEAELPYRSPPYSKRNWGHPLHSLCSYQGKLKPSIGHWLVNEFVPTGGTVLDPLGGVGTIAFEAGLSGRFAVSVDKSPFAATVASAKLRPPTLDLVLSAVDEFAQSLEGITLADDDWDAADFGLNARVKDYYHPDTLVEVLAARQYFLSRPALSEVEMFLKASLLHILHGNRPYALSRRSHPITPFSPTGEFEYRSVVERLKNRARIALREPLPSSFVRGQGVNADFRQFTAKTRRRFDAVITSPPFPGMRFDRPNWLRLWFCGWSERSFHEESQSFLEREQQRSMSCYTEFFAAINNVTKTSGILILHAGNSDNMPSIMKEKADEFFHLIDEVAEDVTDIEKHGISDKKRTTAHHFLFFRKR